MNLDNLAKHVQRDKYGAFWLTEAVRPAPGEGVVPEEGFRIETYLDARRRLAVPALAVAASREKLFDLFLALLPPVGDFVDVILETSHQSRAGRHKDIGRDEIDLPVLSSHFCEFEDLLLHDGCTGVAVIGRQEPIEVQFDEHKLLVVYAHDLEPFERVVRSFGLRRKDSLRLISEGMHFHHSEPRHRAAFRQLCWRLGVGEAAEPVIG